MEEWRDLTLQEWNFRCILEQKLSDLLHQQMVYWRQRGTIKWVKLGDENTKFFHANASISHKRNLITSLTDAFGTPIFDHSAKTKLIWDEFKARLGTSEFERMLFDLDSLLHCHPDLSSLEAPFSYQEIDDIVKHLPLDKSPGPDGFSNEFLEKC